MKAFSFSAKNGSLQIGVDCDGQVYNFSQAWEIYKQLKNQGKGPRLTVLQLMIEADFFSAETFEEVFATLDEIRSRDDLVLQEKINFQPPVGRPPKILCVGRNYEAHADELGNAVPEEPIVFSKSPSALIAHKKNIEIPRGIDRVDHEGEIAVIIGKRGKNVPENKALDYIVGYSLLNDITARNLQKSDVKAGRPWFRAKSFDTFCPFGPYIVPKETVKDCQSLELELRVNGEIRQSASSAQMIFSIAELISYISGLCTLEAGDVIATGTPAGVGPLQSGDLVECEVQEIGTLANPVVTEPPAS